MFGSFVIEIHTIVRFKPNEVKKLIDYTLNEELASKEYNEEQIASLTRRLTNILLLKLKSIESFIKFIIKMRNANRVTVGDHY